MKNKLIALFAVASLASSSVQASYIPAAVNADNAKSLGTKLALVGGGLYLTRTLVGLGCHIHKMGWKKGFATSFACDAKASDVKEGFEAVNDRVDLVNRRVTALEKETAQSFVELSEGRSISNIENWRSLAPASKKHSAAQ